MPIIAETSRLIIRTFTPDEEAAYLQLMGDKRVNEHLPKRTKAQSRKIFRDTIADDANGAVFSKWAVINKQDSGFAGMGLLRTYNNEPDKLETGYCLHIKYWNKGLATELVAALINFAAGYKQIKHIVAVTTPANAASQKVLEKNGLINQGCIIRDNEELAFYSCSF